MARADDSLWRLAPMARSDFVGVRRHMSSMGEFNPNSSAVSSLGYQAWGEVVVGANQKDANQLNFDPEPFGYSSQPEESASRGQKETAHYWHSD